MTSALSALMTLGAVGLMSFALAAAVSTSNPTNPIFNPSSASRTLCVCVCVSTYETKYVSNGFRKSTTPQNRSTVVHFYESKQYDDGFVEGVDFLKPCN